MKAVLTLNQKKVDDSTQFALSYGSPFRQCLVGLARKSMALEDGPKW